MSNNSIQIFICRKFNIWWKHDIEIQKGIGKIQKQYSPTGLKKFSSSARSCLTILEPTLEWIQEGAQNQEVAPVAGNSSSSNTAGTKYMAEIEWGIEYVNILLQGPRCGYRKIVFQFIVAKFDISKSLIFKPSCLLLFWCFFLKLRAIFLSPVVMSGSENTGYPDKFILLQPLSCYLLAP